MGKPYRYVPATISEVHDQLGAMVIAIPNLIDSISDDGVPGAFRDLQEGLDLIRKRIGEALHLELSEMARVAETHFAADEMKAGYFLLQDMAELLTKRRKTN
jgi:hypothetical protein